MVKLLLCALITVHSGMVKNHQDKPVIKKVVVENPKCHNYSTGSAQVLVQGGTPPYAYSLDGKFFQKEDVFKHLKAGDYRIYLKDSKGNLSTGTFKIHQPEKIRFLPARTTNSGCCYPNGAVLVQAVGGTGPVQYQLNESKFQASGYFSGLAGGYAVVAMDSLGCKANLVVKVDDFSGPLIDFLNSTEVTCSGGNNGSIKVYTVGGSGNISYSINGGKTWQKEPDFNSIKAGTYMVKIKDEMGCSDSATIVISQPPAIESNIQFTLQARNDSHKCIAEVLYSIGGTGPHQFSLDGINYSDAPVLYSPTSEPTVYTRDMAGCTIKTSPGSIKTSLRENKK